MSAGESDWQNLRRGTTTVDVRFFWSPTGERTVQRPRKTLRSHVGDQEKGEEPRLEGGAPGLIHWFEHV